MRTGSRSWGGPDDDVFERRRAAEEGEDDAWEDMPPDMEDYDFSDEDESVFALMLEKAGQRQTDIFKWLARSNLAEPIQGGSRADFFIRRGQPVRLEDGLLVEIVSWLEYEGFDESLMVEGYTIIKDLVDGADGECLIFRKRKVVHAPFSHREEFQPKSNAGEPSLLDDGDIPF